MTRVFSGDIAAGFERDCWLLHIKTHVRSGLPSHLEGISSFPCKAAVFSGTQNQKDSEEMNVFCYYSRLAVRERRMLHLCPWEPNDPQGERLKCDLATGMKFHCVWSFGACKVVPKIGQSRTCCVHLVIVILIVQWWFMARHEKHRNFSTLLGWTGGFWSRVDWSGWPREVGERWDVLLFKFDDYCVLWAFGW